VLMAVPTFLIAIISVHALQQLEVGRAIFKVLYRVTEECNMSCRGPTCRADVVNTAVQAGAVSVPTISHVGDWLPFPPSQLLTIELRGKTI
jgi:hypothetical protein